MATFGEWQPEAPSNGSLILEAMTGKAWQKSQGNIGRCGDEGRSAQESNQIPHTPNYPPAKEGWLLSCHVRNPPKAATSACFPRGLTSQVQKGHPNRVSKRTVLKQRILLLCGTFVCHASSTKKSTQALLPRSTFDQPLVAGGKRKLTPRHTTTLAL